MITTTFAAWVLALCTSLGGASYADHPTPYPTARETQDERQARLEAIAEDIAQVAAEEPPGVLGSSRRSAAYLVALAWKESEFARDVDVGPCDPDRVKKHGCDDGRAVSMWQLHDLDDWPERRDAARIALRRAKGSMVQCRRQAFVHRLAIYVSGNCYDGWEKSRVRVQLAEQLATR